MITLFGNLESGNVHKAQMILRCADVPYRRVDVSQVRGEPRHPRFLRLNPIGKVPAVRLDHGDVLSESGAILYYFAAGTGLWPRGRRAQAEVLRWMFFEQYSHEPTLAVIRYLRHFTADPSHHRATVAELEPKARRAVAVMEAQLERQPWMAGASCSIADLALYPYTRMAEQSGIELAAFPAVLGWLASVERLPRFLPVGVDGAAVTESFSDYLARDP